MRDTVKLDEYDVKILRELQKDARISYRELARKVGLSTTAVISRVKALEENSVIESYTAIVNPELVGYDITAVIEVVVSRGYLIEVEKEIASDPSVICVYDITGETDAIIVARFRNRRELSAFVKKILAMPHVDRTITHICLTRIKEDFRVPL
ncbi:MAG: Lrp/AsnC family transcriptional regulator [Nitrososphaerota archaeon]|nr:Lrp/AsnC family transcriptional regulator [Candidatus Bathyarchaeota archaeon]MCX8162463.1 Lrp/AsnC family transcriptional regulator [Candidatus Bathyarchaeota archaeon]MDW8062164.1 Lrp/AsnC family transcriptional regulator [Nitrososphaerota archaeon]